MKYDWEIKKDAPQDWLNNKLIEKYELPLICFAYVIADAIADETILSKKIQGRKKGDLKEAINTTKRTKSIIKNTKFAFHEDEYKRILVPISLLHEKLQGELLYYEYETQDLNKHFPIPLREGKTRSIKKAHQIFILWAHVMKNKKDKKEMRHWEKMIELLNWFHEGRIEKSSYWSKKDLIYGAESTGSFCLRIFNRFKPAVKSSSLKDYFPFVHLKQRKPNILSRHPEGGMRLYPVESILFYEDRIKTVFDYEGKLKARVTRFEGKKPISEVEDYQLNGEAADREELLFKVE